mgnify:CR=1 FL=1
MVYYIYILYIYKSETISENYLSWRKFVLAIIFERLPRNRRVNKHKKRVHIQCLPPNSYIPNSYVLRFFGKLSKIVNEKHY